MSEQLKSEILAKLGTQGYKPQAERSLAKAMNVSDKDQMPAFREALRELMHMGRVVKGVRGSILLPMQTTSVNEVTGSYRHNKRGFGFVVPTDPSGHEDLFIPEGSNGGAITGDVVRATITSRGNRDGKAIFSGRISEIVTRTQKKFVGSLQKQGTTWVVFPDGNMITEPILTPDAASRHIRVGTKVVVELTTYPDQNAPAQGVITDVLGEAGEKDVDLKSVIVQYNLPGDFPDEVKAQAREALDTFDPDSEREHRLDITDQIVCTIDPPDAKDYDDAISLRQLPDGNWELGVHIADVSHFVPIGTALDEEARKRGNSCYFPGHVIPMLPEILSNGVCSLQEGVPRLCKSAFITYDENAKPIRTKFANTIIHSNLRLRYIEAQAIIDQKAVIPHPDGDRKLSDYDDAVIDLVHDMNDLAKRLQARRRAQGQIVLDLPDINLVLDEDGKVIDAVEEDDAFTHTLIEMFMVEANEAVARLLNSLGVPFLRRTHPAPEMQNNDRLRQFVQVAGFKLPKELDRKAIQNLLEQVKGRPEGFAINLAILKSLTRAEYSPKPIGHFALASEQYGHFTSPIRRYADLTIHRLLDLYFANRNTAKGTRKKKIVMKDAPSFGDLVDLGKHISFTERQAEAAERELRQVKVLELMTKHIGEEFDGVITGITNFGIFVQLRKYLIDGLIRYENLMDDWWDVDERGGFIRGQRTGKKIGIGDTCIARIARVDVARRELDLQITKVIAKSGHQESVPQAKPGRKGGNARGGGGRGGSGGGRSGGGGGRSGGGGGGGGGHPSGGGGGRSGGGRSGGGGSRSGGGGGRPSGGGPSSGERSGGGRSGSAGSSSGGGNRRSGGGGKAEPKSSGGGGGENRNQRGKRRGGRG
ncbi:MAG TPA: ribonuclease R [Tepidisphaeraceae bacterium]|jgi:ribonuclease R|nr:ribonuclease R [Tepidisphaeraceae bacterium]